jgi:hypothetical protein
VSLAPPPPRSMNRDLLRAAVALAVPERRQADVASEDAFLLLESFIQESARPRAAAARRRCRRPRARGRLAGLSGESGWVHRNAKRRRNMNVIREKVIVRGNTGTMVSMRFRIYEIVPQKYRGHVRARRLERGCARARGSRLASLRRDACARSWRPAKGSPGRTVDVAAHSVIRMILGVLKTHRDHVYSGNDLIRTGTVCISWATVSGTSHVTSTTPGTSWTEATSILRRCGRDCRASSSSEEETSRASVKNSGRRKLA